ncbi:molybdenum cofactor guanylyltransferase [Acetobacterium wieringae]|uniref:molybdenum cofactor guanylyltransferase n=1 Tax=Acetobacterium wieringae TaxID=52694 RepID=UPI0026EC19BD|nr:molybdenum cofactor guanylyltransferase [Acetobacterium wieringae]
MAKTKTAAILVGGLSQRMGYDKKKLRIGGENILNQIVKQLSIDFDDIIVVGCHRDDIPDISGLRGVYPDALKQSASLVGIYSGLLLSKSEFLYVTACDMPYHNSDYVKYMASIIHNNPHILGCVTRFDKWIEPFNAFYSVDLIPQIQSFLYSGRKSIYECFETENLHYIDEAVAQSYSPGWEMFSNLNTPKDLKTHIRRSKNATTE